MDLERIIQACESACKTVPHWGGMGVVLYLSYPNWTVGIGSKYEGIGSTNCHFTWARIDGDEFKYTEEKLGKALDLLMDRLSLIVNDQINKLNRDIEVRNNIFAELTTCKTANLKLLGGNDSD